MAFSRKTTRYYMDEEDIRGAIRALSDRIADFELNNDAGVYHTQAEIADYWMDVGAAYALQIIADTEFIDNQACFMKLFDARTYRNDLPHTETED